MANQLLKVKEEAEAGSRSSRPQLSSSRCKRQVQYAVSTGMAAQAATAEDTGGDSSLKMQIKQAEVGLSISRGMKNEALLKAAAYAGRVPDLQMSVKRCSSAGRARSLEKLPKRRG